MKSRVKWTNGPFLPSRSGLDWKVLTGHINWVNRKSVETISRWNRVKMTVTELIES